MNLSPISILILIVGLGYTFTVIGIIIHIIITGRETPFTRRPPD